MFMCELILRNSYVYCSFDLLANLTEHVLAHPVIHARVQSATITANDRNQTVRSREDAPGNDASAVFLMNGGREGIFTYNLTSPEEA